MTAENSELENASIFSAADYADDGKHHILLASSGSVATIKLPVIASALSKAHDVSIRIIVTASAEEFLQGQSTEQPSLDTLKDLPNVDGIHRDQDEWRKPWVRRDRILHIELRRWARALLVAPLSANTLAKMTNGISDNLLTSVIRAWEIPGIFDAQSRAPPKRIFVAPAMNTAMWRHPITKKQIKELEADWKDWVTVLRPIEKTLACGDSGDGAMMDARDIVETLCDQLSLCISKEN